jgi:hypothetical protein
MNAVAAQIVTVIAAAFGVLMVAVLVAPRARTSEVTREAFGGLAELAKAVSAPVSGGFANL